MAYNEDYVDEENYENYLEWKAWATQYFSYEKNGHRLTILQPIDREFSVDGVCECLGINVNTKIVFIIPENVDDISLLDFSEKVRSFEVSKENQTYSSWQGSLYSKDFKRLIKYCLDDRAKKTKTIIFHEETCVISQEVFECIWKMEETEYKLILNDKLETIEDYAFLGINNLRIVLAENLQNISSSSFSFIINGKIAFEGEGKYFIAREGKLVSKLDNKEFIFVYNKPYNMDFAIHAINNYCSDNILERIVKILDMNYYHYSNNEKAIQEIAEQRQKLIERCERAKQRLKENPNDDFAQFDDRYAREDYARNCCDYMPSAAEIERFSQLIRASNGFIISADRKLLRYYGRLPCVTVNFGIKNIYYNAFNNNDFVESISIEDEVERLSYFVKDCKNLKEITISESVEIIEDDIVNGECPLSKFNIPRNSKLRVFKRQKILFNIPYIYIPQGTEIITFPSEYSGNTYFDVNPNNTSFVSHRGSIFSKIEGVYVYIHLSESKMLIFNDFECGIVKQNQIKRFLNVETIVFNSTQGLEIQAPVAKAGNSNLSCLVFQGENFVYSPNMFTRLGAIKYILFTDKDTALKMFYDDAFDGKRNKMYCKDNFFENDKFVVFQNEKYFSLRKYEKMQGKLKAH